MTYDELIERLDPAVYRSLKRAIELGKWPDGRAVSAEQRAICMEAVIYYENRHDVPAQERVGFIDRSRKKERGRDAGDGSEPIRILN